MEEPSREYTAKWTLMRLAMLQSIPLSGKVMRTERKIREWYNHWEGQVYVAFSGGMNSTVLLHIARSLYPSIPAVFCDTGLEYPEIRDFVKTVDNVVWLKPKMTFGAVIQKYGFPVVSKEQSQFIREARTTKSAKLLDIRMNGNAHGRGKISDKWKHLLNAPFLISEKCCDVMKKAPSRRYEKESGRKVMTGEMTEESQLRLQSWMKSGCNAFDASRPKSKPMAFWTKQDNLDYVKTFDVAYSPIYDMGYDRTGCMWCAFGCDQASHDNKFQRMYRTHPSLWRYCMNLTSDGTTLREVLDYMGIPCEPDLDLFRDYKPDAFPECYGGKGAK